MAATVLSVYGARFSAHTSLQGLPYDEQIVVFSHKPIPNVQDMGSKKHKKHKRERHEGKNAYCVSVWSRYFAPSLRTTVRGSSPLRIFFLFSIIQPVDRCRRKNRCCLYRFRQCKWFSKWVTVSRCNPSSLCQRESLLWEVTCLESENYMQCIRRVRLYITARHHYVAPGETLYL